MKNTDVKNLYAGVWLFLALISPLSWNVFALLVLWTAMHYLDKITKNK